MPQHPGLPPILAKTNNTPNTLTQWQFPKNHPHARLLSLITQPTKRARALTRWQSVFFPRRGFGKKTDHGNKCEDDAAFAAPSTRAACDEGAHQPGAHKKREPTHPKVGRLPSVTLREGDDLTCLRDG